MHPATPSPRHPPDLVLHIGSGKTGTSTIQRFLHRNRSVLAELGVLYPKSPGKVRHTRLSLYVRDDDALESMPAWQRQRRHFSSPAGFRQTFREELLAEIDDPGPGRLLLSDEALYGVPREALVRLARLTDEVADSLRLVVYLRRQDDHLVSRYQQVVKVGETRRLEERTRQLDLSGTYDYAARLRAWARLVNPTAFEVRRFERDRFACGSLLQDFLDAAGIDARAEDMRHVDPVNETLDAEAVELLRLINLLRREEAAASGLPGNAQLVRRLAPGSTGPTLTLATPLLGEFMTRWEDSNRDVAREYFGEPSGELFRSPRRTAHTTTEQRFDKSRLDHFLTLLELPEEAHAPLRALVEREGEVA